MITNTWNEEFMKKSHPRSNTTFYFSASYNSDHLTMLQNVLNAGGVAVDPGNVNAIEQGIPGEYVFNIEDRYFTLCLLEPDSMPIGINNSSLGRRHLVLGRNHYERDYIAAKEYTLNQITNGQYVFLERPDEKTQLLIPENEISADLQKGDIVFIRKVNDTYNIRVLEKLPKITLKDVNALLEKIESKIK